MLLLQFPILHIPDFTFDISVRPAAAGRAALGIPAVKCNLNDSDVGRGVRTRYPTEQCQIDCSPEYTHHQMFRLLNQSSAEVEGTDTD